MGLNDVRRRIKTVPYSQAADYIDLPRDMNLIALECRLQFLLTISAGAADYTLLDAVDHVARMITGLGIEYGNTPLYDFNLDGSDYAAMNRYFWNEPLPQAVLANGGVQATTVEFNFLIPFAMPWAINPINLALAQLPQGRDFRLRYQFATAAHAGNASNSPGTAAMFNSGVGDRLAVITNFAFSVVAHGAKQATVPWFTPVVTLQSSRTYSAAETALPVRMQGDRLLAGMLVRTVYGANRLRDAAPTNVNIVAGGDRPIDGVSWRHLVQFSRGVYAAKTATYDNEHFFLFADGGKLTNAIRTRDMSDPELQLDVAAPTANPGQIRVIRFELLFDPSINRLPPGISV